jgi:hypothetical protein
MASVDPTLLPYLNPHMRVGVALAFVLPSLASGSKEESPLASRPCDLH